MRSAASRWWHNAHFSFCRDINFLIGEFRPSAVAHFCAISTGYISVHSKAVPPLPKVYGKQSYQVRRRDVIGVSCCIIFDLAFLQYPLHTDTRTHGLNAVKEYAWEAVGSSRAAHHSEAERRGNMHFTADKFKQVKAGAISGDVGTTWRSRPQPHSWQSVRGCCSSQWWILMPCHWRMRWQGRLHGRPSGRSKTTGMARAWHVPEMSLHCYLPPQR